MDFDLPIEVDRYLCQELTLNLRSIDCKHHEIKCDAVTSKIQHQNNTQRFQCSAHSWWNLGVPQNFNTCNRLQGFSSSSSKSDAEIFTVRHASKSIVEFHLNPLGNIFQTSVCMFELLVVSIEVHCKTSLMKITNIRNRNVPEVSKQTSPNDSLNSSHQKSVATLGSLAHKPQDLKLRDQRRYEIHLVWPPLWPELLANLAVNHLKITRKSFNSSTLEDQLGSKPLLKHGKSSHIL